MDISFFTDGANFSLDNGYSIAAYGIINSLKSLGHNVYFNSDKCDLQLSFCQPSFYDNVLRKGQYQIGLTAWESTELPEGWYDTMLECDELWATSSWTATAFEGNGLSIAQVYEHGLEPVWSPKKRKVDGKINFLHHGSECERKGGQLAFDAFKEAFGESNKVHLYLKCKNFSLVRSKNKRGLGGNVTMLPQTLSLDDLVKLYHGCHVNVYPSAGEGFGFSPLQSLGTGMPTICTKEWAPYQDLILPVSSVMMDSPWPEIHPGRVFSPNKDELKELMINVVENYDEHADKFFRQSFDVHKRFDWQQLTANSFQKIFEKFV